MVKETNKKLGLMDPTPRVITMVLQCQRKIPPNQPSLPTARTRRYPLSTDPSTDEGAHSAILASRTQKSLVTGPTTRQSP
ncbi:hypothetical protein J1614_011712 [Plenodomus biglobosus]|nr:hypothetical protein J1614_011712 [Plenodomus biglobosus]